MMEPKYKVGDIVTVKKVRERDSGDYRFSFPDHMVETYGGKSLRIESVEEEEFQSSKSVPDDGYKYRLEGTGWAWASSMFEESSEALSLDLSTDNSLDAFIKRNKRPELDFNL